MKLALMPSQPAWWIWLATLASMAAGLAGCRPGVPVAVVLTVAHAALAWRWARNAGAIGVQIRLAYALVLLLCLVPGLGWFTWVAALGALAMLVLGYCAMGRTLSLLPWNRAERLSLGLLRRTFLSPPVLGRGLVARPCGVSEGVCELEARAAYL